MTGFWINVATYENIAATCPHCKQEIIFNRATDLKTFEPISGQEVACLNTACKKPFHIGGDTINPPFEMFIFDTQGLYEQKRYSSCIVSFAQAWETFFANFLRLELVYKPYVRDQDLDKLNSELDKLYNASKTSTFDPLRSVFLRMLIDPTLVTTVDALVAQYAVLKQRPPRADLASIDAAVKPYAETIYDTRLGELRNQVVHKQAYRPRKDEVDQYSHETRSTLIPLGQALGVQGDDVNWYVHHLKL